MCLSDTLSSRDALSNTPASAGEFKLRFGLMVRVVDVSFEKKDQARGTICNRTSSQNPISSESYSGRQVIPETMQLTPSGPWSRYLRKPFCLSDVPRTSVGGISTKRGKKMTVQIPLLMANTVRNCRSLAVLTGGKESAQRTWKRQERVAYCFRPVTSRLRASRYDKYLNCDQHVDPCCHGIIGNGYVLSQAVS